MTTRAWPGLLVGIWTALAVSARAGEILPPAACPAPCAPAVEKTIPHHRIYLLEDQEATTLPRLTPRAVEVGREVRTQLDVEYQETRFSVTEMELKPRTVEQEVVVCSVVPETVPDPITGKPCTVYTKRQDVKKVKVTVYDLVPVEKHYVHRTPFLRPREQEVTVKQLVLDETTEPAVRKTLRAVPVQQEIKLSIPAPACPAPCLP